MITNLTTVAARLDRVEGQLSLTMSDVDEAAVSIREAARSVHTTALIVGTLAAYLFWREFFRDAGLISR